MSDLPPTFSNVLKLLNIDDYIAPTQACIKPVKPGASEGPQDKNKLSTVQLALNDCLACSGCITTAETKLVTAQSSAPFLDIIDRRSRGDYSTARVVVVTISPQAVASLAALAQESMTTVYLKLNTLFVRLLGCDFMFDTNYSREVAIVESYLEFKGRIQEARRGRPEAKDGGKPSIPLIASACPGWICYAEKAQGSALIPHLSRVKSPQQIMGVLVKKTLVDLLNDASRDHLRRNIKLDGPKPLKASQVIHVAVMPCFDKKLEAARSDFYQVEEDYHEVDLVLTPVELDQLLEHVGSAWGDLETTPIEKPLFNCLRKRESAELTTEYVLHGLLGPSGSFAESILRMASLDMFGLPLKTVSFTQKRNKDLREARLKSSLAQSDSGGSFVCDNPSQDIIVATAYGFRNIQAIVQQIKRGRCPYDYVEIMACPSGCVNGGAQIRAPAKADEHPSKGESHAWTPDSWLSRVLSIYTENQVQTWPKLRPDVYEIIRLAPGSDDAKRLFYTEYHDHTQGKDGSSHANPLHIEW